ncbi:MAG: sugar transferase [Microthrixaceae bacterium]|nr:sugar transferase [Microthrixaceae bacterium]MCO5312511.1 sugar transferase [Microthrixaceae bacterium]HPB44564.1 sugar transferase [Microthrixaceae bacterium]
MLKPAAARPSEHDASEFEASESSKRRSLRLVGRDGGFASDSHGDAAPFTQQQRRGIGAWALLLGVALDAVIVLGVAYLTRRGSGSDRDLGNIILAYTAISTVLLLPTHRRGRVVPRPSETALSVVVRIGLAPLIASVLAGWVSAVDITVWAQLVAITSALVLLGRLVSFKLVQGLRSRGYDLEDVILVGAGAVGRDLAEAIDQNPDCGLLPIGFLDRFDERGRLPVIDRPENLAEVCAERNIRHVILGYGAATEHEIVGYVRQCAAMPIQFYTVPRFFELGVASGATGFEVDGFAITTLGRAGRHHLMWPLKRAFDLVVTSVMFILTLPVFIVVAAAVKLTSPGPILFRQERVSVDHVPFEILKFRTMAHVADPKKQAELDQRAQAVNLDDDRITPIGRFLRKSHLDELPQLINVLKGEMSIVGPRPERPYFVDQHSEEYPAYAHRHRVPAGITGWAQVNGFWGDSSLETRVRLDNRYIDDWSPVRDLVIGLRTIPTLLGKRR